MLPLIILAAAQVIQGGERMPVVWIEQVERGQGMVELVAYARSDTPLAASFVMDVQRTGASSARSRQAGRAELPADQPARLASTRIGPVRPNEDWSARLEMTVDGEVVATADAPHSVAENDRD